MVNFELIFPPLVNYKTSVTHGVHKVYLNKHEYHYETLTFCNENAYIRDMTKFKRPEEYKKKESTVPVSIRIKVSSRAILEREAKKAKLSPSSLMGKVLDDYAEFLRKG